MGRARRRVKVRKSTPKSNDDLLFTFEVFIISGPITEKFAKENNVISRTIQIRGSQTLEDLHQAIFYAFDRYEEHMYEFQVGGKRPMDPAARKYVLPGAFEEPLFAFGHRKPAGDVTRTTIRTLGLRTGDTFAYWFDFGDDWWHQINVVGIDAQVPLDTYPKVIGRVGASPPQHVDEEEEEAE